MTGAGNESIDHNFDVVFMMPPQSQIIAQRHNLAVHACSQVASLQQVFEQVLEFTFLILHDRGKDRVPRAFRLAVDAVDDLIG